MNTLVTGAFGRVGTAVIDHASDRHEYWFLDRRDHPRIEATRGDVSSYDDLADALAGRDAVVHLAGASRTDADWHSVLQNNIIGGYNCFEAARERSVDSVVFASTNHAVGMYEDEHEPEIYAPDHDLLVDHTNPVRPDSYYATSKVFGEALGRYYVENYEYPKRVYVLRIGSVRNPPYDHPYGDAERGVETGQWERGSSDYRRSVHRMKALWQSRRDAASLVEHCLDDETVEFDVFYGVSDNDRSWLDVDHARAVLGYRPRDSAEDWTEPPASGKRSVSETAALDV